MTAQKTRESSGLQDAMEALSRQYREIESFIEIAKGFYADRDVEQSLPLIMEQISRALGAHRSSLFLLDRERTTLWTRFAQDLETEPLQIELKVGLAGLCMLSCRPMNVTSADEHLSFNREVDERTGYRTESVLCAPLFDRDQCPSGVVQLLNKHTGVFTREDEELLHDRVREQERRRDWYDLEAEEVRDFVTELTRACGCSRGALFLTDHAAGELYSVYAHGMDDRPIRLKLNIGIAGLVAVTGKEVNIPDAYGDARFDPAVDQQTGYRTRSILGVPIRNRAGEVIGVIEAINKHRGPFTEEDLKLLRVVSSVVAIVVENGLLIREQQMQFKSLMKVLAASIDAKDTLTAGHSKKVTEYSVAIAKELGFDDKALDVLSVAAMLHDYGKLGVEDEVLKKPGKLTSEEYRHIQEHALNTRSILEQMHFVPRYRLVPEIAGCHHERLDGSGYPDGRNRDTIPFMSKIIAVADVFEALTADRHYRKAMPAEEAFEILERGKGVHFEENVIEAFKRYWHRSPPDDPGPVPD
jgi:GAF domain-containing protein